MKKLFIVANWKSNKTTSEAAEWLSEISNLKSQISNKEIIICASCTLLPTMNWYINQHTVPVKLGAQDISPFESGPYTGEVSGEQLREFVQYVLIGHSERRINFKEEEDQLFKKLEMAKKYELVPIYCVQNEETIIPQGVEIVAYEPPSGISTGPIGNPDTPQTANTVAQKIRQKHKPVKVLYGGSVKSSNVASFTSMSDLEGVLVGGASLDVEEFSKIIKNA